MSDFPWEFTQQNSQDLSQSGLMTMVDPPPPQGQVLQLLVTLAGSDSEMIYADFNVALVAPLENPGPMSRGEGGYNRIYIYAYIYISHLTQPRTLT